MPFASESPFHPRVGQALASDTAEHLSEPLCIGRFPLIVAEGLLIKVPKQMERFDAHIRAFDGSLQKTPEVFQSIRVNVAVDVRFRMVDYLMCVFVQIIVGFQRVGVEFRTWCNVLANLFVKVMLSARANYRSVHLPGFTVKQTEYNRLAHGSASVNLFTPFVGVHEASRAADETFIGLNCARHFVDGPSVHCMANPLEHKPCSGLGNLQVAGDLIRTNTVLAVRQKPHRTKPFVKTDRGVLEDGSDLNRKLLLTIQAFPHEPRFEKRKPFGLATRTRRTRRTPLGPSYHTKADFGVRKRTDCFHQAAGIIGLNRFHDSTISQEAR